MSGLGLARCVPAGQHRGLEVQACQAGVVLQHLLEVGHAPVASRGIAEEPPGHVIVEAVGRHAFQCGAQYLMHALGRHQGAGVRRDTSRGAAAAQLREGEHERENVRLRELGVGAETPMQGVEGAHDLQGDLRRDVAGHVRIAFEVRSGEVASAPHSAQMGERRLPIGVLSVVCRAQRQERRAVGREELVDSLKGLQDLVRRHVGGAGDGVAARRKKGGGRPAAHVVAAVHVGVAVVVNTDGHEVLVDGGDHAGVGIARLVHDVAPVAPDGGERQQDGAPELVSLGERRLTPRAPLDLVGAVGRGEKRNSVSPSMRESFPDRKRPNRDRMRSAWMRCSPTSRPRAPIAR